MARIRGSRPTAAPILNLIETSILGFRVYHKTVMNKISLADFIVPEKYGNKIAFVENSTYRRKAYTYSDIRDGTLRVAASLHQLSIQQGDRVILWGENSVRWVMTFYACALSGIVAVPIDASFSRRFVEKIQTLTDAKLICSDQALSSWNQLFESLPLPLHRSRLDKRALLEIIYTSGTTGEPKGVMITHENVLANLIPVRDEIEKYKRYAVPFHPLGFVHLIPLSHLFGQVMGLFIPQILGGKVIFSDPAPPRVIEAVRRNRASAIICVPQELSLLGKYIKRNHNIDPLQSAAETPALAGVRVWLQRWWKYRDVHRQFGWKFWSFIVGGASLPVQEEEFWRRLGYVVIQGYGLTETAPSVTISHPFKGLKAGSVGKKLPGLEIKIADDGEILVQGPNVSPGYYKNEKATLETFKDGWLHTGDLGRFDENGNLQLLGRKKEIIVTTEGLNVYPQDVEAVLNRDPNVRDSAIIGRDVHGRTLVHAVLVLKEKLKGEDLARIISGANAQLENFQSILSYSVWPGSELPRTPTGKLKRLAIAQGTAMEQEVENKTDRIISEVLNGSNRSSLDQDLGLSSLDRVELLVELERRTGNTIDESSFATVRSVSDIAKLMEAPSDKSSGGPISFHQWAQWKPMQWFRTAVRGLLVFPAMYRRVKVHASGKENLSHLEMPVMFVANHQSIIDVAVILRALPPRFRSTLAPAMGTGRLTIEMIAAALFFNAYPLPRTSVGLRQAIEHTGNLADRGYSPLVFPEGERTRDGKLTPFRAGIGVIVREVRLPVIPIYIQGAYEIWPIHARGPRLGMPPVQIHFGRAIDFTGKDPAEITAELEAWFRRKE